MTASPAWTLEGNPDFSKLAACLWDPMLQHQASCRCETSAGEEPLKSTTAPCLIHAECVKTDNVFPMIPAGAALEDMLTEPPKRKLAKPTGST